MKILRASMLALSAGITGITFIGCSMGADQTRPAMQPTSFDIRRSGASSAIVPGMHRTRTWSWMAPDAKRSDLLYISSGMTWDVDVYSYPQGKREGVLTGFNFPQGLCTDSKGNVFIPNQTDSNILEYAHAGTTPIATLDDAGELPEACTVDPKSGTLAVANVLSYYGNGNVALYTNATGSPKIVTDLAVALVYECGFDNKGDLFIDGLTSFPSGGGVFQFAELPKGSSTFTNIALDKTIKLPGIVQWDGKYMAVGDAQTGMIYQTNGAGGKVKGTTKLARTKFDFQPWIEGSTIIAPSSVTVEAGFFRYPAGGQRYKTITIGSPFGATVSVAGK